MNGGYATEAVWGTLAHVRRCHFGNSLHHALFALLHLGVLAYFLRATCDSSTLRGLFFTQVFVMVSYMVMGADCTSPWILDARQTDYPRFRVGLVCNMCVQILTSFVTTYFISRSADVHRITKMALVYGLCTIQTFLTCWWWIDETRMDVNQARTLVQSSCDAYINTYKQAVYMHLDSCEAYVHDACIHLRMHAVYSAPDTAVYVHTACIHCCTYRHVCNHIF